MATSANRDPPTTLAYCIATAILAALGGYFLGQASSLGLIGGDRSQQDAATNTPSATMTQSNGAATKEKDPSESENEGDPDSEDEQQDLQGFESNANEECKLVLVVRTDLGMTKGSYTFLSPHRLTLLEGTICTVANSHPRQNSSPMRSRDTSLLQSAAQSLQVKSLRTQSPSTMGTVWTGQGGGAGEE